MSHAHEVARLLLIDDHPLIRSGLRLCLEMTTDLRVIGEAEHAEGALAFLHARLARDPLGRTLPHMVLMDLNMPGMGGLSLIEQLHQQFPHIAVLVLSMYDRTDSIVHAIRAGARGYLLKDEPAPHIVAAVHAVMQGRMVFSAEVKMRLSATEAVKQRLTQREREVLAYLSRGYSNKGIAQLLNVSVRTVETHRLNIRGKLNIESQPGLAQYAVEAAQALMPWSDGATPSSDGKDSRVTRAPQEPPSTVPRAPRIPVASPALASLKKDI
ncbi:response regulator [Bordetella sp. 02P26C-1]|uniref:response regulator n=1 Tax=Bordetella sp. 02P26C-1 TaxID=2683195 RepID=UPI0013542F46|nr:response regulator [Bordetella sp. 02P26C-1]